MTPKPAPVKPQPITDAPHAGKLAVVVSFRLPRPTHRLLLPDLRDHVELAIGQQFEDAEYLDVAIRVIGAQGEASEQEGQGP